MKRNKHNKSVGSNIDRSDDRVDSTGEVFTPPWLVEEMIDAYPIEDINEMRQRFVDSYLDTGHNSTGGDRRNDNSDFGVGISFGGVVDLSNQSFGVQVTSGADNANPYNIYQYFHGVIVV